MPSARHFGINHGSALALCGTLKAPELHTSGDINHVLPLALALHGRRHGLTQVLCCRGCTFRNLSQCASPASPWTRCVECVLMQG